jgi:amino acid transporter
MGKFYVCIIGILSSAYAFAGYEGAATLAEETLSPSYVAPRGVLYTCLVSFLIGFLALLGILYGCQENIDYLLNGPGDTSENLLSLVFNHNTTAVALATLLLAVTIFLTGFSSITVLSRMAYSMARDGAFPWSHYLRALDP